MGNPGEEPWVGSPREEPQMDVEPRGGGWMGSPGEEVGWGIQGRSPRWMGSPGEEPRLGGESKGRSPG